MKNCYLFLLILSLSYFQACNPSSQKTNDSNGSSGIISTSSTSFVDEGNTSSLPIDRIKLPEGFKISVYAEDIKDARSMTLGANGTLFVGNRSGGKVYAIVDNNKDFKADEVFVIASNLNSPCGVAFKDGSLYVAEIDKILRFDDIEKNLKNPPKYKVVYDKYPKEGHHGWKYIAFGPDGKLYVPVGAPCNVCDEKDEIFSTITRMNPDGTGLEIYAKGVRNSVGFAWHPTSKELWFTDNGRDMLGDEVPTDELNYAPKQGMHFGFPYCHQGDLLDPEFGKDKKCEDYNSPAQKLNPHGAALGMRFYTGTSFPEEYRNQIFIAEHGSWNRSAKIGYQLSLVKLNGNQAVSHIPFAIGWLNETTDEVWGRPVDVLIMPDGSMLVSDDKANAIYRIRYAKS